MKAFYRVLSLKILYFGKVREKGLFVDPRPRPGSHSLSYGFTPVPGVQLCISDPLLVSLLFYNLYFTRPIDLPRFHITVRVILPLLHFMFLPPFHVFLPCWFIKGPLGKAPEKDVVGVVLFTPRSTFWPPILLLVFWRSFWHFGTRVPSLASLRCMVSTPTHEWYAFREIFEGHVSPIFVFYRTKWLNCNITPFEYIDG